MRIAVIKERWSGERRVAASPDTVKKFVAMGAEVAVERGAGHGAAITDDAYEAAGAKIFDGPEATLAGAEVVLKVRRPLGQEEGEFDELALIPEGAALIGTLDAHDDPDRLAAYAARGVRAFALELLPRISRAQSMDVLSSQSNLAGYRAVIEAAHAFGRIYPMMMTAAGTVPPARLVVVGAGVAGLQAIATAHRLGAVVSAFDVRPAVKEQVQSLGATFIEVDAEATRDAETAGGYAKEMDADYQRKQAAKLLEVLSKTDIIITTALIPGRPAPLIVTDEMVAAMKPGSVIVDLAAERGGNVAPSKAGETVVTDNGVTVLGPLNMASRVATDASAMYARNLHNFLKPMIDAETGELKVDRDDEIVAGTLLTDGGQVVHPNFAKEGA